MRVTIVLLALSVLLCAVAVAPNGGCFQSGISESHDIHFYYRVELHLGKVGVFIKPKNQDYWLVGENIVIGHRNGNRTQSLPNDGQKLYDIITDAFEQKKHCYYYAVVESVIDVHNKYSLFIVCDTETYSVTLEKHYKYPI